jgi:hypothetical protein
MALASAIKTAKRPSQSITWTRADGTAEDLTGATITGYIYSQQSGTTRAIDGTLSVTSAASGVFSWAYGTADVAEAGYFRVQFNAAFGSAPTPAKTTIAEWYVSERLTT